MALFNLRMVTPLLIPNDYAYIILMFFFSLSNGYIGSICMMSAPQVRNFLVYYCCLLLFISAFDILS